MTTPFNRMAATAALLSAALVLGACGGTPDESDSDKPTTETTESTEVADATEGAEGTETTDGAERTGSSVEGFPVGKPFGDAAWSIEVSGDTRVTVRPDRVIVDTTGLTTRTIRAYTGEGKKAWEREVPGRNPEHVPVWVLDETVAILGEVETEGSGLDEDKTTQVLTLLSQEDGTEVAEEDSASVDAQGVIYKDDKSQALTEEGQLVDYEPVETFTINADSVAGIPLDPSIKTDGFIDAEILAINRRQGMAIFNVTREAPDMEFAFFGVDTETGKVAYELECQGYKHTDSENNVAESSPNGKYGVHESVWMTATEGKCFGGDYGQKSIEFTAVDDNGTAYGITEVSGLAAPELVVIPKGGEPEVLEAPAPVGIMNGGIAVHINGKATNGNRNETIYQHATLITGNPIAK
jgi:hypothetical protein